ncbi:MAG: hypothetical protein HPY44_01560 [Armatimonadetes bacterium]|nr:hypothetical protein [Armatimonadota bacterium]
MRSITVVTCCVLLVAACLPLCAQQQGATAEAAGLVLRTLTAEELDVIEANSGYRLGVQVVEVKPNSAGAAAGYKQGDLIFAVGQIGVVTAEQAVAAIAAAQGAVDCVSAVMVDGAFQVKSVSLNPLQGATQTPDQYAGGVGGGGGATAVAGVLGGVGAMPAGDLIADAVNAYFDIMDFTRTEGWGRKVVTAPQDRQRAYAAMLQAAAQLPQEQLAQLAAIPQGWRQLQQDWAASDDARKNALRAQWRDLSLSPSNTYAPIASPQQFTADGGAVAFEYPANWTGGFQQIQGATLLFLGPNGAEASWESVLDAPRSPVGVLFALLDVPQEMQGQTYVQAARVIAQQLMPNAIAGFREVEALPIGDAGAIITLLGKFPGATEDHFFWIAVSGFGSGKVFVARFGGPFSQAETLLPIYRHIAATMSLNPPQPEGGVVGSWRTAWDRIETASIAESWAKFHEK